MTPLLFTLLCLFCWKTAALIEKEEDREENHIISSSSGRYTVKEEIQKAPDTNHFCNLTVTSVKISFPEMKSRVFVNFLGYKVCNQGSFRSPDKKLWDFNLWDFTSLGKKRREIVKVLKYKFSFRFLQTFFFFYFDASLVNEEI